MDNNTTTERIGKCYGVSEDESAIGHTRPISERPIIRPYFLLDQLNLVTL